jgi:hypothetical protein
MDLLAVLRRSGGIDAVARQIDGPPPQVTAGIDALLPALLASLRGYAQQHGGGDAGVAGLLAMVNGLGNGQLAADVMGPGPLPPDAGDALLGQLVGLPEARRRLASDVAAIGGLDSATIGHILPLLAMLVCGYISARAEADAAQGDSLSWLRDLLMLDDSQGRRPGE